MIFPPIRGAWPPFRHRAGEVRSKERLVSYYVSIRRLCRCCFPLRVARQGTDTIAVVDPRASKAEMLRAAMDLLEPWEYDAARRAYGQPPAGLPMDQFFVEGSVMPYVPPVIRLPGESAIQTVDYDSEAGLAAFQAALDWWDLELQMDALSA